MPRFLVQIARRVLCASVVCLVLSRGIALAGTVFLFDFEADLGQQTPFTSISNGVSATFSSPADPSGFFVLPTSSLFSTLTGNALFQVFPSDQTLGILFDRDIQYVQLVFGSTTIGQLTLTASDQNLIQVGQTSATSNFLPGGANPEGSISFGGTAFRSLTLRFASSDQTGTFAIDNVTDVPEPTLILLFGLGALTLGSAGKLRSRS